MDLSTLLKIRSLQEDQITLMVDPHFLPAAREKLAELQSTIMQIERELAKSIDTCQVCGKGLCEDCNVSITGQGLCKECDNAPVSQSSIKNMMQFMGATVNPFKS